MKDYFVLYKVGKTDQRTSIGQIKMELNKYQGEIEAIFKSINHKYGKD